MSYIHGYDPQTLREQIDARQCKDRLAEIGEQRSLPALLERVWLLKVLDRLEDALVLSELSVRVARMAGTRISERLRCNSAASRNAISSDQS